MKNIVLIIFNIALLSCNGNYNNQFNSYDFETDSNRNYKNVHDSLVGVKNINNSNFHTLSSISRKNNTHYSCDSLDDVINKSIKFNNAKSIRNSFVLLKQAWRLNDRIYFISKDSSQYISMGSNYGGAEDEYKDAKIEFIEGEFTKFIPNEVIEHYRYRDSVNYGPDRGFYFTASDFVEFKSKWGIHLGMTTGEFIKIMANKKLKKAISNNSKLITYKYSNEECLFYGIYIFKLNKLISFDFGFITP